MSGVAIQYVCNILDPCVKIANDLCQTEYVSEFLCFVFRSSFYVTHHVIHLVTAQITKEDHAQPRHESDENTNLLSFATQQRSLWRHYITQRK